MTLEESIAKLNLGELSISQFPQIALQAIQSGIESESLFILAGMNDRDNIFEIKQYLERTIEELEIKSYHSLDAAFVLANSYVNQVKDGKLNVVDAIYNIKNECWQNCHELIKSEKYLYDGVKFEKIIGPWYEYYEIDENAHWVKDSTKSKKEIKSEIENSLKEYLVNWQSDFLENQLKNIK